MQARDRNLTVTAYEGMARRKHRPKFYCPDWSDHPYAALDTATATSGDLAGLAPFARALFSER